MRIFHGTRLYAVDGRSVGSFGGRSLTATVKIYDGSDMLSPRATISAPLRLEMLLRLKAMKGDRVEINDYLRKFLPDGDPYRVI